MTRGGIAERGNKRGRSSQVDTQASSGLPSPREGKGREGVGGGHRTIMMVNHISFSSHKGQPRRGFQSHASEVGDCSSRRGSKTRPDQAPQHLTTSTNASLVRPLLLRCPPPWSSAIWFRIRFQKFKHRMLHFSNPSLY